MGGVGVSKDDRAVVSECGLSLSGSTGGSPTINSGGRVSSPDSPDKSPILGLTCKLLKSKCWRHCIECQLRIGPFNKVYLYIGFNEGSLHLIYSLNGTRDGLENHVDVRVA